jgi:hypothetical protein
MLYKYPVLLTDNLDASPGRIEDLTRAKQGELALNGRYFKLLGTRSRSRGMPIACLAPSRLWVLDKANLNMPGQTQTIGSLDIRTCSSMLLHELGMFTPLIWLLNTPLPHLTPLYAESLKGRLVGTNISLLIVLQFKLLHGRNASWCRSRLL